MRGAPPAFPAASNFLFAAPAVVRRPARPLRCVASCPRTSAACRPAAGMAAVAMTPCAAAPPLDSSDSSWEPGVCRRPAAGGATVCKMAAGAAPAALPLVCAAGFPVGLQPLLSDGGVSELLPVASEPAFNVENFTLC